MGAVYNIVTKQGTNQFHGDTSYFFQSNGLTSNNTTEVKFPNGKFADACADDPNRRCPWTRGDYFEATAQLGGPIVRDKLWFFASYGHQRDQYTTVGVNSALSGSAVDTTKDRVLTKATWQVTPSQRVVGNFHRDKSPRDGGYSFNETPSTAWTRTQTAPTPGVAYTATLSNKTLLDVRYSGFFGNVTGLPSDPQAPLTQPRIFDGSTGNISGGNYYWYRYDANRTTATAKVSHHADQFLGAEQDFQKALELNPQYPTAHQWYGSYLMQMGKFDLAMKEIEKAHALDPLSPIISSNVGFYSYLNGKYDEAIVEYKKLLGVDQQFWVAHHYLGLAYAQKGMNDQAIAELRTLIRSPGDGPIKEGVVEDNPEAAASLGYVYAVAGKRAEAEVILARLRALAERRYVSPLYFATVYAGLKDRDRAVEYLNKAYADRHPGLVLIRIEPMFQGLRSDARFQQLIKRFEPLP